MMETEVLRCRLSFCAGGVNEEGNRIRMVCFFGGVVVIDIVSLFVEMAWVSYLRRYQ